LIKRRSKAARKEEQEGSKEPAEPVQAGEDHHKIQIKKEEKGTRTKPDTNFSSSKNLSNKVNKLEQAIDSVLIIIIEKIRGAIGLPSDWHRDAMLDHHGVFKTKVNQYLFLSTKGGLSLCIIGRAKKQA
jgi:hypothetical protein